MNQAAGLIGKPEERARNFSVLALAFSTSSFLGPVTAGFAIDAIGYRYTFLLLAGSIVATLAIMLARPIVVPRHAAALSRENRSVSDLLRMPALRRVFVVSGMLSMAWDLFSFVMPIHGSRLQLSASTVGPHPRRFRSGGLRGPPRAAAGIPPLDRMEASHRARCW